MRSVPAEGMPRFAAVICHELRQRRQPTGILGSKVAEEWMRGEPSNSRTGRHRAIAVALGVGTLGALACATPQPDDVSAEAIAPTVLAPGVAMASVTAVQLPLRASEPNAGEARYQVTRGRGTAFFAPSQIALSIPDASGGVLGLHVHPIGASVVVPRGEATLPSTSHVLGATAQERTPLAHVQQVVYDDLWPGVDLVVEAAPRGIAYRLLVDEGQDASRIQLRWTGADAVNVAADGRSLTIRAREVVVRETGLRCFEAGAELPCGYRLTEGKEGTTVGFEVTGHQGGALLIDPTIDWGTYLGSALADYAVAVVADAVGNAYVFGVAGSGGFPVLAGFDDEYDNSGFFPADTFILKVDATGTLVWSSFLGGSGTDNAYGLAIDVAGDLYVTGSVNGGGFPIVGGFDTTSNGSGDAFVAKIAGDGSAILWSSYLGGSASDAGRAVAVDATGNVIVVGTTSSSNFPSTGGADTTANGGIDGFATKIEPTGGSLVWSTYLGGASSDYAHAVAVTTAGDIVVAGSTNSAAYPATVGLDTSLGGFQDAVVTRFDAAGALVWSTFLGGAGAGESIYDLALDAVGAVYVVGETAAADFPVPGGFDTVLSGTDDAFVAKLSGAGALVWGTFLGGSSGEDARALVLDAAGNVLVTGGTSSSDFPTPNGFDTTFNSFSGFDAYVAQLDPSGATLLWASFLGGAGQDFGTGIALDPVGNVFLCGETSSADFPTAGGFDTTDEGTDGYLVKVAIERANGSPCLTNGECVSGNCEGVCCAVSCGLCSSCEATGTTCSVVPADDAACGVIECDGFDVPCRNYDDLTSNRCEGVGDCKESGATDCTVYTDLPILCSDGSVCTYGDMCMGGVCVSGPPPNCDDANVCTADSCAEGIGCTHTPTPAACDDGDLCTTGDTCASGSCGGTPVDCDDGNACTTDVCDAISGCEHPPNEDPCDDGDSCTAGDVCSKGACGGLNTCPDAGVADAGPSDGGTVSDASTLPDAALPGGEDGGCGCDAASGRRLPPAAVVFVLLAVAALRRRRRT